MPVVANVDAEFEVSGVKNRVTEVAWFEEKLLVKAGINLRYVRLAILAEIAAIRINYRGGVVIDAGHIFFINRYNNDHVVLLRIFLHQSGRVAIRNTLGRAVPFAVLARAEICLGKYFLKAQNLHTLLAGIVDIRRMRLEHDIPDLIRRRIDIRFECHLDQSALYFRHHGPRFLSCYWRRITVGGTAAMM